MWSATAAFVHRKSWKFKFSIASSSSPEPEFNDEKLVLATVVEGFRHADTTSEKETATSLLMLI
jgi:hypothetical protein